MTGCPPPQVEVDPLLSTFSISMQQRSFWHDSVFGSFMVFLHSPDILSKDSCSLRVSSPDLVVSRTHMRNMNLKMDTHRDTQIQSHLTRECFSLSCSTGRNISCTDTQAEPVYIYLAQELTHACFTCLIVLVGHETRLRECVSLEEKTREEETRGERREGILSKDNKWHPLPAGSPRGCFPWAHWLWPYFWTKCTTSQGYNTTHNNITTCFWVLWRVL